MSASRWLPLLCAAACASAPAPKPAAAAGEKAPQAGLGIPVQYEKLSNGLKVVLSPDHTAPLAAIAVYYGIGFRIEPRDRTGFAHLFEHMMFQGSRNLGKLQFIRLVQSNGGLLNGSTRFDFTNYYEVVPANTVEPMLWAEADRMKGLAITQENLTNQQGVVKSEVRVNVLNRPYGGFPWLPMPQVANSNWYNARNFYGDLTDLDAATLDDVQKFFKSYYAPNNAVLAVVGDIDPAQVLAWAKQYFEPIPRQEIPPRPDITEPRQEQEKRVAQDDKLATRPALAFAYHVPPRNTPEWYAMGILREILAGGHDSLLYQELVQKRALTGHVDGDINELGSQFNVQGPTLLDFALFHDKEKSADEILAAADEQIEKLRSSPVDAATLKRAKVKIRAQLYDELDAFSGFGKADLLAAYALFDDAPQNVNHILEGFEKVTPELVQKTAQEWLRKTNRTVLVVNPGAPAKSASAGGAP
ncbi:MAG: M16 family metallopeptidase [Myxococcales bacterium]